MQRNERISDPTNAFLVAFEGMQAGLWTALPGTVRSYDPARGTVTVSPAVRVSRRDEQGVVSWLDIPLLVDVPVVFPGGGGFQLTFPLADGDPVLVVFASRCIDTWWDTGTTGNPPDARMHDLSDGFAIPGPRPRTSVPPAQSTTGAELRNEARSSYVRIDADGNVAVLAAGNLTGQVAGDVNVTATGDAFVAATNVHVTGNVTIQGTLFVTGDATLAGSNSLSTATIGGVSFTSHVHNDPQGGTTGGPH